MRARRELQDHRGVWLYRIFDIAGRVLYIGISNNPGYRFITHDQTKNWWPQVAGYETEWYPTRKIALAEETAAIHQERPLYNIDRPYPADELLDPQPRRGEQGGSVSDLLSGIEELLTAMIAELEHA